MGFSPPTHTHTLFTEKVSTALFSADGILFRMVDHQDMVWDWGTPSEVVSRVDCPSLQEETTRDDGQT